MTLGWYHVKEAAVVLFPIVTPVLVALWLKERNRLPPWLRAVGDALADPIFRGRLVIAARSIEANPPATPLEGHTSVAKRDKLAARAQTIAVVLGHPPLSTQSANLAAEVGVALMVAGEAGKKGVTP